MSSWRAASAIDLERVAANLRRSEWAYVPFSSRLREARARTQWSRRGWEVMLEERGREPVSALLVTRSGLVLPALGGEQPLPPEVRSMIYGYSSSIFSVMGTMSDVRRVQEILGHGHTSVDYSLMTVDVAGYRPPATDPGGMHLRRVQAGDARRLFALQHGYELEEVLLEPTRFNEQDCLRRLRRSLRREIGYYGTIDGHPVTKASTSGRGFAVDQIGGVFTAVDQRRRGYGGAVMAALLEELFALGKSATLFVKLNNPAALRLYRTLGFIERDRYRICYYYD